MKQSVKAKAIMSRENATNLAGSIPRFFMVIAALCGPHPAAASGTVDPNAPMAGWSTHTLLDEKGLVVRLVVKEEATLADVNFLRLEFENTTSEPIVLPSVNSYHIDRETFDLKTGRPLGSGGMASGNDYDLFGALASIKGIIGVRLPPGTYVCADHPSAYSAALLGLPGPHGQLIKMKVNLHLAWPNEKTARRLQQSAEFCWLRPDTRGMETLRMRLKEMLAKPDNRVQHCYMVGALLKIPELADSITTTEFLDALNVNRHPFSGRPYIVPFIAERRAADPAVISYYAARLAARDGQAIEDLQRNPAIWDNSYVPLLVNVAMGSLSMSGASWSAMELLDRHASLWDANSVTRESLSKHVLDQYPELTLPLDQVVKRAGDPVGRLERGLKLLGQTRAPKMIGVAMPMLASRLVVRDFEMDAMKPSDRQVAPERLCDVAYNAICALRGRPEDRIEFRPWESGPLPPYPPEQELARRDKLITEMMLCLGQQ